MSRCSPLRLALAALALAAAGPAAAQPLDAATLQRLLQSSARHDLRFTESRESKWLGTPVLSSGSMSASPAMLEKRVEQPRRETWRILKDRMSVTDDSGFTKEFLFDEVPAVAALANAMRNAVAGDVAALRTDFELHVDGDERLWTVELKPRRADVSRYLSQIELQGSRGRLQAIVVLETQGDRTITRLLHDR
jgi:hypothetical protein